MGAFRNQTKKPLFDAHGREILPGQIIGIEGDHLASESPQPGPELAPADAATRAKGSPTSQPESKGGKASTK